MSLRFCMILPLLTVLCSLRFLTTHDRQQDSRIKPELAKRNQTRDKESKSEEDWMINCEESDLFVIYRCLVCQCAESCRMLSRVCIDIRHELRLIYQNIGRYASDVTRRVANLH